MLKQLLLCAAAASTLLAAAPAAGRFEPRPQMPRSFKVDESRKQLLFENGKAKFEIVYGKSTYAMHGAVELSDLLHKALGVKVPVRNRRIDPKIPAIFVGDIEMAKKAGFDPRELEWGGFRIVTSGKDIIIAGRDDREYSEGTLYGVYEFLERFAGIRFYFPGEIGTVIPKITRWELPAMDISDRPDMQTRTMYSIDPFPNNFHGGGPRRWYEEATRKTGHDMATRRYRIQRRSPFQSCHGLAHIALVERFSKTNPEFFALNERGSREMGGVQHHSGRYGHVCYSSEGLKKELVLDAKAVLTGKDGSTRNAFRNGRPAWPSGNQIYGFFNVMPNDSAYYCQCEKCKPAFAELKWNKRNSVAASTLTWKFMSDIANTLKKDKVPGYVLTMSYAHYAPVPEVEIPDNMLVMLALTGPWSDFTPHAKKEQMDRLKAWRKKLGARPYLWNYATKFAARIQLVPNCTPRAFGRYYKEVGDDIFGAFLECETDYWIFGFMNYYIFGRMMWDKKADADAILAEHYKLMYGAGAPEMTRFFDLLEDIWMRHIVGKVTETDVGPVSIRPSEFMLWNEIYSPALRKELDSLLKKASAKCAKDPDALKRIAFMRREFYDRILEGAENYRKTTADVEAWKGYIPELKGEKITVDGKASEKAWSSAPAHYLLPNSAEKSESVEVRTFFKALRDKDNFYFALKWNEPLTDKMLAADRKFDDKEIWMDSTAEVFISPDGNRDHYYQILVNSKGKFNDLEVTKGAENHAWNSNAEVKTSVEPGKCWNVEIRLPRKSMIQSSPDGVRINFARHRAIAKDVKIGTLYYTWSPFTVKFGHVSRFGKLLFNAPAVKPNLILNPDFDPAQLKGSWAINRKALDNQVFMTAGSAVKLNCDGKVSSHVYQYLPQLKPNTEYEVRFFVKLDKVKKLESQWSGFYVRFDHGNGEVRFFPTAPVQMDGTCNWTGFKFTVKTPADYGKKKGKKPYINFIMRRASGNVWIDRVSITEVTR